MFKEMKVEMIVSIILYVVIGMILIIWPGTTAKIVNYMLAVAFAAGGVYNLGMYFKKDVVRGAKSFDLSAGIVLLAIALFLALNPKFVVSILPVVLGSVLFISGAIKFQNAVDVARTGYKRWPFIMLLSLVTIVIAVVILINPFDTGKVLMVIIGVALVYSGLSDLVAVFFLQGKIKQFKEEMEDNYIEVEVKEEK